MDNIIKQQLENSIQLDCLLWIVIVLPMQVNIAPKCFVGWRMLWQTLAQVGDVIEITRIIYSLSLYHVIDFNIVFFHHPPFTTAKRDPASPWMAQPYAAWGADLVLMGHEHVYERLSVDGIPYIINGLGGYPKVYNIDECVPDQHSQFRYLFVVRVCVVENRRSCVIDITNIMEQCWVLQLVTNWRCAFSKRETRHSSTQRASHEQHRKKCQPATIVHAIDCHCTMCWSAAVRCCCCCWWSALFASASANVSARDVWLHVTRAPRWLLATPILPACWATTLCLRNEFKIIRLSSDVCIIYCQRKSTILYCGFPLLK
jgi:hypothetical protein